MARWFRAVLFERYELSGRLQLFEFEDLSWFPDVLRRAMTRYLKAALRRSPLPAFWAEKLAKLAPAEGGVFRIVDLGSGSGGPIDSVAQELQQKGYLPEITLTDLYPDPESYLSDHNRGDGVQYWPEPVDATCVPPGLAGVRTMFLSFHHHSPERARAILRDAFEKRTGIAVFEGSARDLGVLLSYSLVPLAVLLLTPTIRPLKPSQVLLTYIVPVLPIFVLWDGLVSCLRTYSAAELQRMTSSLRSDDYIWEVGELKGPFGKFPWLIGRPKRISPDPLVAGAGHAANGTKRPSWSDILDRCFLTPDVDFLVLGEQKQQIFIRRAGNQGSRIR